MAVEIAEAYVSLIPSFRGGKAAILAELGPSVDKAATEIGTRSGKSLGDSMANQAKRGIAGVDLGAGVEASAKASGAKAGKGLVDAAQGAVRAGAGGIAKPIEVTMEASVVAAAKRAAKKATDELSRIPGGIDAEEFKAKVAAAASDAAAKARAQLSKIPVGFDVSAVADVAAKSSKKLPAPEVEQPEIPEPNTGAFLSGAKKAGIAAGVAVGAAFVASVAANLNFDQANDKLAAQLGATGADAKGLGKVAGDLYAGAFGDSIGQVNDAIKSVLQSGALPTGAINADIERITGKALDLSTAFDQEVGRSAVAAGQLIRTGMAANADEAFDILTVGFQNGADNSQDLLDTLIEYPTQFRKFGIDGKQATGILAQGLKAGARNADLVADAIKEFSIRAVDGSKLTAQGFRAVGLNAEQMAHRIAQGGATANDALDETLDRLRAIPDPVQRAQAAVALFGTQAEDLGDALFAIDPSSAVAALGQVEGAAERMGQTLNNNGSTKFEAFRRTIEVHLAGVVNAFGPVLAVAPALGGLATVGATIAPALSKIPQALSSVGSGASSLVSSIGSIPIATAGAVAGLGLVAIGVVNLLQSADAKARTLIAGLEKGLNVDTNFDDINVALQRISASAAALDNTGRASGGFGHALQSVAEILPFVDNRITDAQRSARALGDEMDRLSKIRLTIADNVQKFAVVAHLSGTEVKILADRNGIDLSQSLDKVIPKLQAALDKTKASTPVSEDLATAYEGLGSDISTAADRLDAFSTALDAVLGVGLSAQEATIRVGDSILQLGEALKGEAVDTQAAAKAERTLKGARLSLAESSAGATKAQDAYNAAVAEFGPNSTEAKDAANTLARAQLGVGEAQSSVTDAEKELSEARRKGTLSAEEQAKKNARVQQSLIDVVRASEDEVDALAKSGQISSDAATLKQALIGRLQALKEKFPELAGPIDGYIAKIGEIPDNKTTTVKLELPANAAEQIKTDLGNILAGLEPVATVRLGDFGNILAGIEPRATGGPVNAFEPYLVGEEGPELVVPPLAGYVIPADLTAAYLAFNRPPEPRAAGGPVWPGVPYLMGEKGTELVIPAPVNTFATMAMSYVTEPAAPKGGKNITVPTISVHGQTEPLRTAREIIGELSAVAHLA